MKCLKILAFTSFSFFPYQQSFAAEVCNADAEYKAADEATDTAESNRLAAKYYDKVAECAEQGLSIKERDKKSATILQPGVKNMVIGLYDLAIEMREKQLADFLNNPTEENQIWIKQLEVMISNFKKDRELAVRYYDESLIKILAS